MLGRAVADNDSEGEIVGVRVGDTEGVRDTLAPKLRLAVALLDRVAVAEEEELREAEPADEPDRVGVWAARGGAPVKRAVNAVNPTHTYLVMWSERATGRARWTRWGPASWLPIGSCWLSW